LAEELILQPEETLWYVIVLKLLLFAYLENEALYSSCLVIRPKSLAKKSKNTKEIDEISEPRHFLHIDKR
jgi:hypothetical protein